MKTFKEIGKVFRTMSLLNVKQVRESYLIIHDEKTESEVLDHWDTNRLNYYFQESDDEDEDMQHGHDNDDGDDSEDEKDSHERKQIYPFLFPYQQKYTKPISKMVLTTQIHPKITPDFKRIQDDYNLLKKRESDEEDFIAILKNQSKTEKKQKLKKRQKQSKQKQRRSSKSNKKRSTKNKGKQSSSKSPEISDSY